VNSNGVYTVTVSDIHGCTATASHSVVFSSSFNVNITGPASGCSGTPATLCVPAGYSSYTWSTGATGACIQVSLPGNYSVTVHDNVGCVANSFYNIAFNPPPTVSISGASVICNGALAGWCATPGFPFYLWSNGGTAECINVSSPTTYTVQVTDTNGCMATASQSLDVVDIHPTIFESNGLLICDTFNTGFTYSWLINGSPTNCDVDTCVPNFSAVYSVIVTDIATGCSEIATYNFINTGVSFENPGRSITLFPNPFSGNEFNIGFINMISEPTDVLIFDATGRLMMTEHFRVPTDEFIHKVVMPFRASGIYSVQVSNARGHVIRKMVCY
jgi:hypothetical protein